MIITFVLVLILQSILLMDCTVMPQVLPVLPVLPVVTPKPPTYRPCTIPGYTTGWVTWDGKTCYMAGAYYARMAWHDANQFCQQQKAQLVSIHDPQLNAKLSELSPATNTYASALYWTGLNSLKQRGLYRWSDGSVKGFTNIANTTVDGKPLQSKDPLLQGRCVVMRATTQTRRAVQRRVGNLITTSYVIVNNPNGGLWYTENCNAIHNYICEKGPGIPVVTPTSTPPGNCPAGWIQYANQKCVKYLPTKMNWKTAKAKCTAISGELLSIHSAEEENFITSLMADKPMTWIGMHSNSGNDIWSWDDESKLNYAFWAPQITYNYRFNDSLCAALQTNETGTGKWFIHLCNATHPALCERPKDPSMPTHPKPYLPCTISGFTDFTQYRKSCYKVVEDPNSLLTFNDAEAKCQSLNGAHLVSVVNPFEYAFLKYYLAQYGKADQYWLGLYGAGFSDTNVTQVFKWTDNWPNYYTSWDTNEPLFAGEADEECVFLLKSNGTWRTGDCTVQKAYICKASTDPVPKLGGDYNGVCPRLNNNIDRKLNWVDVDKRSKYCYWFSTDMNQGFYSIGLQSYTEASFQCKKRNGTLASIHSAHDLALFKPKVYGKSYNTWIGLAKSPLGDYKWEDQSELEFTNWDPTAKIVNKQTPINDDTGDMCVQINSYDMKWSLARCTGYASRKNLFICQTPKIASSGQSSGLSGGSKAGIAIGVILLVVIIVAGAIYAVKKFNIQVPALPSFDNKLYQSRRGAAAPKSNGSGYNNMNSELTKTDGENPFNNVKVDE